MAHAIPRRASALPVPQLVDDRRGNAIPVSLSHGHERHFIPAAPIGL
jgi:hypothetical protein